jgi:D-alanine-D-alanine ligase
MFKTRNKNHLLKKLGRIGVLMGGPSAEREISLQSGEAVYTALKDIGADVSKLDITSDSQRETHDLISNNNIDIAFIALHGPFGEDGRIQNILQGLGMPYTGSGPRASFLAMDKIASRQIFVRLGLKVPASQFIDKNIYQNTDNLFAGFPLVVKPATQGSSIGLSIVDNKEDLLKALDLAFQYDERVIVERYIGGREITVGILAEKPLPVIEIVPKNRFFDFQAKYQKGLTDYIVPANLPAEVKRIAQRSALLAHKSLGCFGCSRVDMILDQNNKVVVLEVNTIPGLTQTSLLPKAAKVVGIEFPDLVLRLLELAHAKKK